jgi:hypothetical protein
MKAMSGVRKISYFCRVIVNNEKNEYETSIQMGLSVIVILCYRI